MNGEDNSSVPHGGQALGNFVSLEVVKEEGDPKRFQTGESAFVKARVISKGSQVPDEIAIASIVLVEKSECYNPFLPEANGIVYAESENLITNLGQE